MLRRAGFSLIVIAFILLSIGQVQSQDNTVNADVAAYQLGVTAEAIPGSEITYNITITNFGPSSVQSFYILDGWSVNAEGISAFDLPVPDPNFGNFTVKGSWEQDREDEKVVAWLLEGNFVPGATIQFAWTVKIASAYAGGLVNWARILANGQPDGTWKPRQQTTITTPPPVNSADDPDDLNNRTPDGVTVVTESPTGQGIDLAVFQTGLLIQVKAGDPIRSTLLVTNLGPQPVTQFYLMAGWSLDISGGSLLALPVREPNFGDFAVVGRWSQNRADEELWLWLLEGELASGESVSFDWSRNIVATYRGDLINWARVISANIPEGTWIPREPTTDAPVALTNPTDTNAENDRTVDGLTTVIE
jgi:hypothetical protein